jgi:AraC-like DNA-binding protein
MAAARDWTNATGSAGAQPDPHMYGHVLRPEELLRHARYDHAAPAPALRRWVDRYWSVTWDLPTGRSHRVATLDEPAIHLTREWGGVRRAGADGGGTWATGPVTRGRFDVVQSGVGGVVGIRFRLGGTRAFTGAEPVAVRDRTVPAADWFGADMPEEVGADGARTAADAAPLLDDWLATLDPVDDPEHEALRHVLALLADPTVTDVAELERRTARSARTLQRMFRHHLGVGPKRILLRARVQDAIAAIDRGDPRPLPDLAQDLGWFDQSHFIRDVRTITSLTPAAYARRAILEP